MQIQLFTKNKKILTIRHKCDILEVLENKGFDKKKNINQIREVNTMSITNL